MGSTKHFHYSEETTAISLFGRAFAHPCRIKMVELLIEAKTLNNQEFSHYFGMTRSTIHDHLVKLWQAGVIEIESCEAGTLVSLNMEQLDFIRQLISLFSFQTKDAYHLGVLD
ncbi:helix-turn-helix transcriptional regulator [Fluviicola sp.]|uniref:winged helix-turn-helix domain-containing protein n=1 Tax=Fluviicola sp. TaxID=1917219 RepID=UPI0031CE75B2